MAGADPRVDLQVNFFVRLLKNKSTIATSRSSPLQLSFYPRGIGNAKICTIRTITAHRALCTTFLPYSHRIIAPMIPHLLRLFSYTTPDAG